MHFATSFVALVGAACATTGLAVPLHQPHANHTHPTAVSLRPAATSTVVAKLVNLETAAAALDARSTEAKKKHKSKHQLEKENKKYAKEAKKQQEKQAKEQEKAAKKQEKKKKGGFLGLGRVWHNSPASKISRRSEETADAANAADAVDSADGVIILNNGPDPDAMVIGGRSEQSSSSKKKGVQTMVVPGNVGNLTVLATKDNKKQVAHWCGTQLDSFRWDAPCPSPAVFINNPFRGMGKTKTHKKSPSYKCDRGTAAMKYARAKGRKGPLADNLRGEFSIPSRTPCESN